MRLTNLDTGVVVSRDDDKDPLGSRWAPESSGAQRGYHDLTVSELKDEIRRRNDAGSDLLLTGSKDELVESLDTDDKG